VMTAGTPDVNSALWSPLQRALATNELTLDLLGAGEAANTVHLARAAMNSGFSMVLIAEHFCDGTIRSGPALEPEEMLDSAVTRFQRAIDVATEIAGNDAARIVNASRVGMARAYLQQKDYANAAAAAADVPDAFVHNAVMIDDANSRELGNLVYSYDFVSRLLIVPPDYRALDDPRVPWDSTGQLAQATELEYFQQLKHTGYTTDIRIASGLEARYIEAEALLMGTPSSTTEALDLIAERRAVGGQGAFAGTTQAEILAELMDQRARDFWLEAKHLGDWRRNPAATPYVAAAGTPFYKPAQGAFGNETCLPVPLAEVNANPNF
jgi:starch-binding outer membrane protein, SusD/RagB family